MTRILWTLAAVAGLAGACSLTSSAYSDEDDDGDGRRGYRVYESDDDDGDGYRYRYRGPVYGPSYQPVPQLPQLPLLPLLPTEGRFYGRVEIHQDHGRDYGDFRHGDDHRTPYVPPPPVPEPAIVPEPDVSGPQLPPLPGLDGDQSSTYVPAPQVESLPRRTVEVPPVQHEIVAPQVRCGEFVSGPVPLFPRVKVEDREDVHPRAVPAVVAVRSPHGRGVVFVQVFVPPFPPDEVDTDDDGRSLTLEYDDYSVEIEADDGRVTVDYND
jgi:hypothetical protein